jgi:hypothetical protein
MSNVFIGQEITVQNEKSQANGDCHSIEADWRPEMFVVN